MNLHMDRLKSYVLSTPSSWVTGISVIVILILANILVGTVRAQIVVLEHISGEVLVTPAGTTTGWYGVHRKTLVREGQHIRLGQDSSARLYFNDGSRVTLEAGSMVTLDKIRGNWLRSINVILIQEGGSTRHRVQTMRGIGSGYQVVTPAGIASVRGTNFSVAVEESGYARFSVDSGAVLVQKEENEVTITAGQALVTRAELPVFDAAYQFSLTGPLAEKEPDRWSVNQVDFMVSPEALIEGDLQVGSHVFVEGHTLNGQRIADHVRVLAGSETISSFTGILKGQGEETWQVDGVEVQVNSDTDIVGVPEVNQAVQVVFSVSPEGHWVAQVMIALEKPVQAATPNPAATKTAKATSTLAATATPIAITKPTTTPTFLAPIGGTTVLSSGR